MDFQFNSHVIVLHEILSQCQTVQEMEMLEPIYHRKTRPQFIIQ